MYRGQRENEGSVRNTLRVVFSCVCWAEPLTLTKPSFTEAETHKLRLQHFSTQQSTAEANALSRKGTALDTGWHTGTKQTKRSCTLANNQYLHVSNISHYKLKALRDNFSVLELAFFRFSDVKVTVKCWSIYKLPLIWGISILALLINGTICWMSEETHLQPSTDTMAIDSPLASTFCSLLARLIC